MSENLRSELQKGFDSIKDGGAVAINYSLDDDEASKIFTDFYGKNIVGEGGARARIKTSAKTITISRQAVTNKSTPAPAAEPETTPEPDSNSEEDAPAKTWKAWKTDK
tara:strand:+ start:261 stop:584 length:324 start_codon:yes stop_codon:yes gene_type:complete